MIQFVHPLIDSIININFSKINNLVIEDSNFLVSIIQDIKNFLDKNDTEVRFLENNELYKKIDKLFLITDIFNIDFNNKILQNTLIKKMVKSLDGYEFQINEIYQKAYKLFSNCIEDLNISIDVNYCLEKSTFVKMFTPTIQSDFENLLEKLVLFVNVLVELIDLKCLITLNLQEFLTKKDIELFYTHCQCREVAVLNLLSRKKYEFDDEQVIVIDSDLCETIAKLDN